MRKKLLISVIVILVIAYLSPMAVNLVINSLPQDDNESIYENANLAKEIELQKGDYIYFGSYNDEAILWNVIEDSSNSAVLFSEKILCFKSFDAKCDSCEGHSTSDLQKFGTADYKYSAIRQWLNSESDKVSYKNAVPSSKNVFMGKNGYEHEAGFLSSQNFQASQREKIESVFLLSQNQLNKIPQKKRTKSATNAAIKNNESPFIVLPNMKMWYWTSSDIKTNKVSVCTVTSSGNFYKALAFDSTTGICPALKLNTKKLIAAKGDGSKSNPYVICRGGESA